VLSRQLVDEPAKGEMGGLRNRVPHVGDEGFRLVRRLSPCPVLVGLRRQAAVDQRDATPRDDEWPSIASRDADDVGPACVLGDGEDRWRADQFSTASWVRMVSRISGAK